MKTLNLKKLTFYLLVVTAVIFSAGCSSAPADPAVIETEIIHDVSPADAKQLIDEGAFILDVRTPDEWNQAHIQGSALIPVDRLSEFLSEVPQNETVLVYCRSGNRSSQALDILLDAGYTDVYNMLGGINTWISEGYSVEAGQ